eukprot:644187-Pelagomonas_calceolata.AAC.2
MQGDLRLPYMLWHFKCVREHALTPCLYVYDSPCRATCACPACFSPIKNTGSSERACKPNCPMANCSPQLGLCMPEPVPSSSGSNAASGGSLI